MFMSHCNTSTTTLHDSFAGASLIRCIAPWSQNPLDSEPSGGATRVVRSQHTHPGFQFRFEMEATGNTSPIVPPEAIMRILCHLLLEQLPAESIPAIWGNVH